MAVKYFYKNIATGGAASFLDSGVWFNGSGGTGGATTAPTGIDDAIVDANSFPSGVISIKLTIAGTCKSINLEGLVGGSSTSTTQLIKSGTVVITGGDSSGYSYRLPQGQYTAYSNGAGGMTFGGTGTGTSAPQSGIYKIKGSGYTNSIYLNVFNETVNFNNNGSTYSLENNLGFSSYLGNSNGNVIIQQGNTVKIVDNTLIDGCYLTVYGALVSPDFTQDPTIGSKNFIVQAAHPAGKTVAGIMTIGSSTISGGNVNLYCKSNISGIIVYGGCTGTFWSSVIVDGDTPLTTPLIDVKPNSTLTFKSTLATGSSSYNNNKDFLVTGATLTCEGAVTKSTGTGSIYLKIDYGTVGVTPYESVVTFNNSFQQDACDITLTRGTLNFNYGTGQAASPNFICRSFTSSNTNTRTLYVKPTAYWELTGTLPWDTSNLSGLTINAEGSFLKFTGKQNTTTSIITRFGYNVTYTGTGPDVNNPVVDLTQISKVNTNINYGTVWFNRTNSSLTHYVLGSGFFEDFWDGNPTAGSSYATPAHTLAFEQGKINVFKNFNVNSASGATGNRITLDSCDTTPAIATGQYYFCSLDYQGISLPTLSPKSNFVKLKKVTIKHSAVSPPYIDGVTNPVDAIWFAGSSILDTTADTSTGWFAPINKYWVPANNGGTGTWDLTTTTNWSDISGGTGGADAPTIDNNVFFDSLSGNGTVTVANLTTIACKSINFTGFRGTFSSNNLTTPVITITFTGGTNPALNLGLAADTWTNSYKGTITILNSTTGTATVTSGSKVLQGNLILGNSTGDTTQKYAFTDFFKTANTAYLNIISGAVTFLGVSGLYNASVGQMILNTATSTKSLTCSSGIELTGGGSTAATNVNVWQGDGANTTTALTLNVPNIYVTNTTLLGGSYVNGNTAVPFQNLYFNASGAIVGTNTAMICDNIFISSASPKITFNTTTVNNNVDFTGSTGKWDQGALSNVLTVTGNITIPTTLTVTKSSPITFNTTGTSNLITNGKTLSNPIIVNTSGNVVFRDDLITTSTVTLTAGTLTTKNLTATTITLTSGTLTVRNVSCTGLTVNSGTLNTTSGDTFNLGSGTITSAIPSLTFNSDVTCGSQSLTTANTSLIFNGSFSASGLITVNSNGGSLVFNKGFTTTTLVNLTQGNLTIGGNSKCSGISSTGSTVKSLTFVNNTSTNPLTIELTGSGSAWNFAPTTGTGLTTPDFTNTIIKLTNASTTATVTFAGGDLSYGTVWFNREGTGTINYVTGSNSYKVFRDGNLYNNSGSIILPSYNILAHTITFDGGSTHIFDSFQVSGTSANPITLTSNSNTTNYSFNSNITSTDYVNCYFLSIIRNTANRPFPPNFVWVGYSSSLGTNTTGWRTVNVRYWVPFGDGNWGSSSNWSTKSAGAFPPGTGGALPPTANDVAIFDAYSGNGTVNVNVAATCLNLKFSGDDNTSNSSVKLIGTGTLAISQGLYLSPSMTMWDPVTSTGYTGTITFNGDSGNYSITNNGELLNCPIVFTAISDLTTWDVTDYFNSLKSVTLNRGILNFSGVNPTVINGVNYNATMFQFVSNGALTRTVKALNLELTGGSTTTITGFNCWDTTTATAGFTNNVTNIHVTGTSNGIKYVSGNTVYTLGNIWFYGTAPIIGIGSVSQTGNIYVRSVGATASAIKFFIISGTSIQTVIKDLDFTGSKVDWNSGSNAVTLTGSLYLTPNFTASNGQDLVFTPPANSVVSIFNNGWLPGGNMGIYTGTITITAPSTSTVNYVFGSTAVVLNSGKLNLGLPYNPPTWNNGQLVTNSFTINGGNIITDSLTQISDVGNGSTGTLTVKGGNITNLGATTFKNITIDNGASLTLGTPDSYTTGGFGSVGGTIAVNGTLNSYVYSNNLSSAINIGTTGTGIAGTLNVYNTLSTSGNITLTQGDLNLKYQAVIRNLIGYFKPNTENPGSYPTDGSGAGGAIKKGDYWIVSNVGYVGTTSVYPMHTVIATVDNPTTSGDWNVIASTTVHFKCYRFISNSGLTRSITIGDGSVFEINGVTTNTLTVPIWDVSNITNLSISARDSVILLTGFSATNYNISLHSGINVTGSISSPVITNSNIKYGHVIFNRINSTVTNYLYGSNVFQSFSDFGAINNPTQTGHTLSIEGGSINIFDAFNVNGASSVTTSRITLNSTSTTLAHNLISTGANIQSYYLNIKNSNASSALLTKWYAIESTDQGGNTGWIFQTVTRYWVGGGPTTNWNDKYNWAEVSGGNPPASPPEYNTLTNTKVSVVFDSNSGNGACNINITNATCFNFDCKDFGGTFNRTTGLLSIYGNANLGPSFATLPNYGSYNYVSFYCTDSGITNTINYSGGPSQKLITSLKFYGPNGTWQMTSPLYTSGAIGLYSGTFDTGGYGIIADSFSYGAIGTVYNLATLNLNNSTITLTGYGETWDMSGAATTPNFTLNAGGSTIEMTNNDGNSATYYVRFYGGGKTYNKVKFNRGNNTARNYLTGPGDYIISELSDLGTGTHTLYFGASCNFTFDNIILNSTINPSSTNIVTFASDGATPYYFHSTNNYRITCKNVTVNSCVADICKFSASGTYVLGPGTTGWNSTSCGSGTFLLTGVGQ